MTVPRASAAGRAVEVYRPDGPGRYVVGTGFLLDGGLVLTAAHVVGPAGGQALVRIPGRAEPWTGTVLWHRHDEPRGTGVDAALLRVTEPGFRPPRTLPALGWGRLAGATGSREVEAVGFPAGMELLVGDRPVFRDSAQILGEIAPGSRFKAGRYEIRVRTPVPPAPRGATLESTAPPATPSAARHGNGSRWSGMSGAGVLSEGLLVALVAVDPGDPTGGALTAVPVESILADPAAARLLGAVRPRSVELAPVLLPPPTPPRTPAGLLRADVTPVGCHGREDLVADLVQWCDDPGEFSLRLLTAPGGQGKTRLARELVERMTDREWAAGFLDEHSPPDRLDRLAGLSQPLLLVMDYAETRPDQLTRCLNLLHAGTGSGSRVRLLLLARGAGEWWNRACATTRALRELPADAVRHLPPLAPDTASRAEAFRRAAAALAPALEALPGIRDEGLRRSDTDAPPPVPRLGAPRYSGALALHMAALTALLEHRGHTEGRADPVGPADRAEEDVLLLHEERYWTQTAPAHRIEHLHPATLRQLVAAATLHRAATHREARALLSALGCLAGETANTLLGAAVWLHELYGGPDGYWTGLVPDVLGAHLVGATLREFPELLDEVTEDMARDRAGHALRVLCRARDHFPELRERTVELVTNRPRPMAFAALDLMTQEPDETLATALDAVLDAVDSGALDEELPVELLAAVPRYTEVLADRALRMARQTVVRLRAAPAAPPARLPDALRALAYRLSAVGLHTEAVAAAEEAVRLRGGPGHDQPGGNAELIDVLLGYGARLDEVGRHEEAARVGDRLLALIGYVEPVTGAGPERARADEPSADGREEAEGAEDVTVGPEHLATILHHHACWCHRAGRSAEALRLGARSVAIRRLLADGDPGRPPEELAGSLLNHALYLQAAGAPAKAADPLLEAVATLRRLVEESPDAHLAALGRALHDQGRLNTALNRPDQALVCAEEAVSIHRRLAGNGQSRPRTADLAVVLVGLAARLTDQGETGRALDALEEAVSLRRSLAADGEPASLGRLAVVLTDHAALLRQSGHTDRSRRLTDEAVRALNTARRDGWNPSGATAARILMHHALDVTVQAPAVAGDLLQQAVTEAQRSGATDLARRCEAALTALDEPAGGTA
ncbi:trypsin-like peptidase domain-containing protein [Streptomyces griseus]|uniref:trypsin-like peptidase domain-containing protein n=1 Tax=Streptomyces griseus TaxID=1911 RepID=UPI00055A8DC2|nr:trypsin-like peptidase domain-containing protein [Streptomyces griseus]